MLLRSRACIHRTPLPFGRYCVPRTSRMIKRALDSRCGESDGGRGAPSVHSYATHRGTRMDGVAMKIGHSHPNVWPKQGHGDSLRSGNPENAYEKSGLPTPDAVAVWPVLRSQDMSHIKRALDSRCGENDGGRGAESVHCYAAQGGTSMDGVARVSWTMFQDNTQAGRGRHWGESKNCNW